MATTSDRVLAHLGHEHYEYSTAKEIAQYLRVSPATVSASLRKLEAAGRVRKVGEAFDGGKTWGLTSPDSAPYASGGEA